MIAGKSATTWPSVETWINRQTPPRHPEYFQQALAGHPAIAESREWLLLDDDHGNGVHNHMCPYITIILRGGYWETLKTGKYWRPPGYIGFRSADNLHRVDLKQGTRPMTLFIPGPFGLRKGPRAVYNLDFKTKNK